MPDAFNAQQFVLEGIPFPRPAVISHFNHHNSIYRIPSLQLIQMLQPRQHHLFTRLLNLPRQKHLI